MTVNDIIKNKSYLAWYVKDPANLSEESVLEHVLNYGDWEDVQTFIKIKGIDETAKIFSRTISSQRSNYSKPIKSYFIRYFNYHANTNT